MFDGFTLNQAVENCFDEAQECIDKMLPLAEKSAAATLHYRLTYLRVYELLESKGGAISTLDKKTKGNLEVAQAELDMTLAQARYEANHQQQLLWKKRGDYYRELGNREYSQAGDQL